VLCILVRMGLHAAALVLVFSALSQAQLPAPTAVDRNASTLLRQDFVAFDPQYQQERQERVERIVVLAKRMLEDEAKGKKNTCGHQILFELEHLIISSANFRQIDRRIHDLEATIGVTSSDKPDADGMWGACYEEWYLKLYATYDHLEAQAGEETSARPLPQFLARVSTPEKLTLYLDALSLSDVRHTGVDQEPEFNETLATLVQMMVRGKPQNYSVDPALRDALMDRLLHHFRNAETGFWGERYRRNGREDFPSDLSLTFHVVSYLKGKVPEMPRVVDTTLAVRDLDYPVGWLWQGELWNHNNMDVAALFRLGWPEANATQRRRMAAQMKRMLDWCLHDSLQPDGSFKPIIADGSVADAQYYGTSFLARIGFFDPAQRFWTDQSFPSAPQVKARILHFIHAHQGSEPTGDEYRSTLELLK